VAEAVDGEAAAILRAALANCSTEFGSARASSSRTSKAMEAGGTRCRESSVATAGGKPASLTV